MRVLFDTHTILWCVDQPHRLSRNALTAVTNPSNDRFISVATVWEISIKNGLRKLALSLPFRPWIEKAIADLKLAVLPITIDYADKQTSLPHHHRDPFDRLLVSQSLVDSMPIVSVDPQLDPYGVTRIW